MDIQENKHAALARRIVNEFVDVIGDAERGLWNAPAEVFEIVICQDWKNWNIRTAATDGKHIFFNPKFYSSLARSQRRGLILHEALHNVLDDFGRRGSRDVKKWNIATDYANNLVVLECGEKLPDIGLVNFKYRGWTAERIYDELFGVEDGPEPESREIPVTDGDSTQARNNGAAGNTNSEVSQDPQASSSDCAPTGDDGDWEDQGH